MRPNVMRIVHILPIYLEKLGGKKWVKQTMNLHQKQTDSRQNKNINAIRYQFITHTTKNNKLEFQRVPRDVPILTI